MGLPFNVTAIWLVSPVKFNPVINTSVPMPPLVGVKELMVIGEPLLWPWSLLFLQPVLQAISNTQLNIIYAVIFFVILFTD
jgi:hypothetical protein